MLRRTLSSLLVLTLVPVIRMQAQTPSDPILVARTDTGIDFVHVGGDLESKRYIVEENGSGVALFDYDGDGDLDVYFVNGSRVSILAGDAEPVANALYRNDWSGGGQGWRFVDVTAQAGVGDTGWGQGVAVGDYDGDGAQDLFVANYGPNVLYRNRGDGSFEDATAEAGLGEPKEGSWSAAAAFADLDGDGDLDLYVSRYLALDLQNPPTEECDYKSVRVACGPIGFEPQPDLLYENRAGRFVEVSAQAGLGELKPEFGLGVLVTDVERDGRPDLVVANDSGANFLLHNEKDEASGDGIRLAELAWLSGVATTEDGRFQAGMGVDGGDVDGDGTVDLFFSHFMDDHNTLYLGRGSLLFRDASYPSGLGSPSRLRMGWGGKLFDADDDGNLDVYVANGHLYPEVAAVPNETYAQDDQLFLGDGAGRFADASDRLRGTTGTVSRGVAAGDLDGDGDVDLVVTQLDRPPLLLENVGAAGGSLRLLAARPGTWIEMTSENRKVQRRYVTTSGSYASASEAVAHFGLGGDEVIRVEVREGGEASCWLGLAAGLMYRVERRNHGFGSPPLTKGELEGDFALAAGAENPP